MYLGISIIFLCIISVFEIIMCYYFLFCIIMKKKDLNVKEKVAIIGCVGILGILLTINRLGLFFSDNMLIFCILITCINAYTLIRHDVVVVIEVITIYYAIVALLDFFFSFLCISFLEQEYYRQVYHNSLSKWSFLIFICSRTLVVMVIRALRGRLKLNVITEYKNILLVFCFVLYLVLRIYQKVLYGLAVGISGIKWWGAAGSLLTAVIIIMFCMVFVFKYKIIQREYDVLATRNEMLEIQYQKIDEIVERDRRLNHDIKNQLLVLQGMEQIGDLQGIHQYLNELGAKYIGTTEVRWSENRILDLVIKQKKSEAEKADIRFNVIEISFLHMVLTIGEVVSLFGNLLDNAIEACMFVEKGKRFISLKVEQNDGLLFVKIQNSVDKVPPIKNNSIRTTKTNGKTHGYGLKNVQTIVNKYDGVMSLMVKNHVFYVDISFFSIRR